MTQTPLQSPLQSTLQARTPQRSRLPRTSVLIMVGLLAALISLSLASSITLNDSAPVEFGQGNAAATACTSTATVRLATAVDGSGNVEVSSVTVSGLTADCNGKYLRATLTGGGSVRDQVVWYLSDVSSCTGGTFIATGTVGGSSSSSNSCATNVSTIYPKSDVSNGGVLADLAASSVTSIQLETNDVAFTASA